MAKNYDVIIIGGGVAGLTAAIYSARAGVKTLIVESMFHGGQMATTASIENYPGFINVDGADLAGIMLRQAEGCGAEIVYGELDEQSLSLVNKTLKVNGEDYIARAIIVATGAKPRLIGLPNEAKLSGRGVSYCATCDGALQKGKDVVIVGGGNSAVEEAIYLSSLARAVHIVHRRQEFRASVAEVAKLSSIKNITTHMGCACEEIIGVKSVEGVVIRNTDTGRLTAIDAQGLFVAIGREPVSAMLSGIDKDAAGYILADQEMRTSIGGVFAAGDVRVKSLRQIVTAAADGAIAGNNAAIFALKE